MITPSGTAKIQKNQGLFKNQSLISDSAIHKLINSLSSESLLKIALAPTNVDKPQPINQDLSNALSNGSNNPGISGDTSKAVSSPNSNDVMPSDKSITPSGSPITPNGSPKQTQQNGTGGLSPFLKPTGENESNGSDIQLIDEKKRLREAAGAGFSIGLKRTNDGKFEAVIIPPQGYTIPSADEFATALLQAVRGTAEDIGDPDPRTGTMRIVYRSGLGPQKVIKK